jgi:HAD superfamily hydrolase (TIGR01509 family)
MLKAVMFDMDGVIVDSEPIYYEVEMQIYHELGMDVPDELRYSYVGTKTEDMWSELKEKYLLKQPVEELVKLEAERYRNYITSSDVLKPVPGAIELLQELFEHNISIALASSSFLKDIEMILGLLDIRKYFSVVVGGDEVKKGKPEPDIFEYAVKKLGVSPENCIVIEDSSNGTKAAKAAGIKCIGYKNKNSGSQDLSSADLIIESMEDIDYETLRQLCEEVA